MKVAIYSIISDNYGNRLQNYALQAACESLGLQVYTVRRESYTLKRCLKDNFRRLIKYDRYSNFVTFNQKISWAKGYVSAKHIEHRLQDRYEIFIIGSDQIWNPTFPFSSAMDYLPFVKTKKIISYAASFGISQISDEYSNMIKKGLMHIDSISVREESGAEIVKNLTGKDVNVHIDPTMLLDATSWTRIAKCPKNVDCDVPYILTYFLGGRSDQANLKINQYAKEHNLAVYNLLDSGQPNVYAAGPSEFIYLISHAKLVMTDSFHACVFSFLFKKPFLVYDRIGKGGAMMSRMQTFLGKFGIERKYANSNLDNELFECNYEEGFKQLQIERKKAMGFLKKSMHLEEAKL